MSAAQRFKSSQEAVEENPPTAPKEMRPVPDEKMPRRSGDKDNGAGA